MQCLSKLAAIRPFCNSFLLAFSIFKEALCESTNSLTLLDNAGTVFSAVIYQCKAFLIKSIEGIFLVGDKINVRRLGYISSNIKVEKVAAINQLKS